MGNALHLPNGISMSDITFADRFCWARMRFEVIDEFNFPLTFDDPVPSDEKSLGTLRFRVSPFPVTKLDLRVYPFCRPTETTARTGKTLYPLGSE